MIISIIGTNGMLSVALTKYFFVKKGCQVDVYGLDVPKGYTYNNFYRVNLLTDELKYDALLLSDIIIYASGAGVQAALKTDSSLMYALNVNVQLR